MRTDIIRNQRLKNTSENRYDIFISHSSSCDPSHHELVDSLAQALRRHGLKVFMDRISLVRGERLVPTLEEAINSSTTGLIVLTRQALESGWVEFEFGVIRERLLAGRMRVLGLILDRSCRRPRNMPLDVVVQPPDPRDFNDVASRVIDAVQSKNKGDTCED